MEEEDGEILDGAPISRRKIVPNKNFLKHLVKSVELTNEPLYRVEKRDISSLSSTSSSSCNSYASFQSKGEEELLKLSKFYGIDIEIVGYNKNANGYDKNGNNNNKNKDNIDNNGNNNKKSNKDNNLKNDETAKLLKRQRLLQRIAEIDAQSNSVPS